MGTSTIGIKIANGNYYPIIEENITGKKRLILTTVNDHQESVQIDLYRSEGETLAEGKYIGSLILENMEDASRGEPEIELILGVDEEGNLNATAGDALTGEKQSLALSLDALSEEGDFELPAFDLDSSIEPMSDVTSFDETLDSGYADEFDLDQDLSDLEEDSGSFETQEDLISDEDGEVPEQEEPVRRVSTGLLLIFIILGLIIVGLLTFLVYRSFQGDEIPPLLARLSGNRTSVVDSDTMEKELAGQDTVITPPAANSETVEPQNRTLPDEEESAAVPEPEDSGASGIALSDEKPAAAEKKNDRTL